MITLPDQRMLQLIELLQESGRIQSRQEFLDVIGMIKQHFRRITLGQQHFSPEQIARACEAYRINANWILGLEETMYRRTKRATMPVAGQNSRTG